MSRHTPEGAVRRARWSEYPALAALVATRMATARSRAGGRLASVRRVGAWLWSWTVTLFTLAGYGGCTLAGRKAVVTAWVLEGTWRGLVRASPLLTATVAGVAAVLIVSPLWVALLFLAALVVGLCTTLCRAWRLAPLRRCRPPGAVFVANLASREPGAGKVVLGHVCKWAADEGRHVCLEATAHPKLLGYYRQQGFDEGHAVRSGRRMTVYMERKPPLVIGPAAGSSTGGNQERRPQ